MSHWHTALVVLAGWPHREQQKTVEYPKVANRALREQLGKERLRLTDEQRRGLR